MFSNNDYTHVYNNNCLFLLNYLIMSNYHINSKDNDKTDEIINELTKITTSHDDISKYDYTDLINIHDSLKEFFNYNKKIIYYEKRVNMINLLNNIIINITNICDALNDKTINITTKAFDQYINVYTTMLTFIAYYYRNYSDHYNETYKLFYTFIYNTFNGLYKLLKLYYVYNVYKIDIFINILDFVNKNIIYFIDPCTYDDKYNIEIIKLYIRVLEMFYSFNHNRLFYKCYIDFHNEKTLHGVYKYLEKLFKVLNNKEYTIQELEDIAELYYVIKSVIDLNFNQFKNYKEFGYMEKLIDKKIKSLMINENDNKDDIEHLKELLVKIKSNSI